MNQAQIAAIVRQVGEQQKKTITEIRGLQEEVTSLRQQLVDLGDKISNGAASDELSEAVEALKTQAQAVDDAIPDHPVVPQLPNVPADPNAPTAPVIPGMPPDGTKPGPNSPVGNTTPTSPGTTPTSPGTTPPAPAAEPAERAEPPLGVTDPTIPAVPSRVATTRGPIARSRT